MLQDQLDAFKAQAYGKMPDDIRHVLAGTIAMLEDSGQAARALGVGDRAPAFTLPDADGTHVASDALLARGPLVVTFYRGVWCPFCNIELKALQAALGDIESRGASVVAISPQTATNSRKSVRDNALSFPILTDFGNALADKFGLKWVEPADMQAVHRKFGTVLPDVNGEPSWSLPLCARYVIGRDGVIAYASVNADWVKRPDPSEMFGVLEHLKVAVAA